MLPLARPARGPVAARPARPIGRPTRPIARRPVPVAASPDTPPPVPTALLLEADGVVIDTANEIHRVAFNAAFKTLGMDCANWSPALYADLVRTGDGTGVGLVATYFGTVGWPTMLATADRGPFAERVHALKLQHAARIVAEGEFELRGGVRDVVDDALAAGARVALLGGTAAQPGVADAARLALGSARDVVVFNVPDADEEAAGDKTGDDDDDAPPASYEASFAAAAAKVKSAAAAALVNEMAAARAASGGDGDGLVIDQALLAAAAARAGPAASPQWLAAVAASLGIPCARCAVVGARSGLLAAARGAGMVACAAPPRAGRGTAQYPAGVATVICDGFGAGGGVTWRKLAALMDKEAGGR